MKATLIAGPYGSGKTTTIRQILPDLIRNGEKVGVFVAESSSLVTDTRRYDLPDNQVLGASFGCVCCPNESLLKKAISTASERKDWDHLIIEPPGNLDPKIVLNALIQQDITPERVLMLVPYTHFAIERVNPVLARGIESASVVGITKIPNLVNLFPEGLEKMIKRHNSAVPVIPIHLESFSYHELQEQPLFKIGNLKSDFLRLFKPHEHHNHYQKVLQGIDPNHSREEVIATLEEIARTSKFVRGKGEANAQGIDFDIVHSDLDIRELSAKRGVSGYFVGFALEGTQLPQDLIRKLGPRGEKITYSSNDATSSDRMSYFLHLLQQSKELSPLFNGIVQAHFEPLDSAYHLADEIFRKDSDSTALQMVLTPRVAIRMSALKELKNRQQPNKHAVGAELSSYLIQHMTYDKGRDFPKWMDISQRERIIAEVIPSYFTHLTSFSVNDINYFPEYASKQGHYFVDMAQRAIPFVRNQLINQIESARKNMVTLHAENYPKLAQTWENIKWKE